MEMNELSNENKEKLLEIVLKNILIENNRLQKQEKHRKKMQSERNKRYYQRHRDEILKKNREMRMIYKAIKQG